MLLFTRQDLALLKNPSSLSMYFLKRRMLMTVLRMESPRYSSFSLSDFSRVFLSLTEEEWVIAWARRLRSLNSYLMASSRGEG